MASYQGHLEQQQQQQNQNLLYPHSPGRPEIWVNANNRLNDTSPRHNTSMYNMEGDASSRNPWLRSSCPPQQQQSSYQFQPPQQQQQSIPSSPSPYWNSQFPPSPQQPSSPLNSPASSVYSTRRRDQISDQELAALQQQERGVGVDFQGALRHDPSNWAPRDLSPHSPQRFDLGGQRSNRGFDSPSTYPNQVSPQYLGVEDVSSGMSGPRKYHNTTSGNWLQMGGEPPGRPPGDRGEEDSERLEAEAGEEEEEEEELEKKRERAIKEGYRQELEKQIEAARARRQEEIRREKDVNDHPLGSNYAKPKHYIYGSTTNFKPSSNNNIGSSSPRAEHKFNSLTSLQNHSQYQQQHQHHFASPNRPRSPLLNQHPTTFNQHPHHFAPPPPQQYYPQAWPGSPYPFGSVPSPTSAAAALHLMGATGPPPVAHPPYGMLSPSFMPTTSLMAPPGNYFHQPPIPPNNIQLPPATTAISAVSSNHHSPPVSTRAAAAAPQQAYTSNASLHSPEKPYEHKDATQDELDEIKQHSWQTSDQLPDPALKTRIYQEQLRRQILEKQRDQQAAALKEKQEDERLERKIKEYEDRMRREVAEEQNKILRKILRPAPQVPLAPPRLPPMRNHRAANRTSGGSDSKAPSPRPLAPLRPLPTPPPSPPIRPVKTREQMELEIREKCLGGRPPDVQRHQAEPQKDQRSWRELELVNPERVNNNIETNVTEFAEASRSTSSTRRHEEEDHAKERADFLGSLKAKLQNQVLEGRWRDGVGVPKAKDYIDFDEVVVGGGGGGGENTAKSLGQIKSYLDMETWRIEKLIQNKMKF